MKGENFHKKLNCLTKTLNDFLYVKNNIEKMQNAPKKYGGYWKSDYETITDEELIKSIIEDLPSNDPYMNARIKGVDKENVFIIEMTNVEYSLLKTKDYYNKNVHPKFSSILSDTKKILTGEDIKFEYKKVDERLMRDAFSQNGKVLTVYAELYECNF